MARQINQKPTLRVCLGGGEPLARTHHKVVSGRCRNHPAPQTRDDKGKFVSIKNTKEIQ